MKTAVPKNDKKRRKQLTEDIAKLEAELNQKHENELKQLQNPSSVSKMIKMLLDVKTPYLDTRYIWLQLTHSHIMDCSKVEEVSNALDSVSIANEEKTDPSKQSRSSKAQKKRVSSLSY